MSILNVDAALVSGVGVYKLEPVNGCRPGDQPCLLTSRPSDCKPYSRQKGSSTTAMDCRQRRHATVLALQMPVCDEEVRDGVSHVARKMPLRASPLWDTRIHQWAIDISRGYPEKRVCLLGGRFGEGDAEFLAPYIQAFVDALTKNHPPNVRFFTGSRRGIQQCFVECGLGLTPPVINLLPKGEQSELPPSAVILEAGSTEKEKTEIFGQIGDIYIAMAGGPGVTKEANAAAARGATVVPLAFSGGASAKLSPSHPEMGTDAQWEILSNKDSSPEVIAQILIGMIRGSFVNI